MKTSGLLKIFRQKPVSQECEELWENHIEMKEKVKVFDILILGKKPEEDKEQ